MMIVLQALTGRAFWEEVDNLTEYKDGLYTWDVVGTLALSKRIPGTRLITNFDYEQFVDRGEAYLKEVWPEDKFNVQKRMASSAFSKERLAASELLKKGLVTQKEIRKEDIYNLLSASMLIALVNATALTEEKGYNGHWIVIFGSNIHSYQIHDPGLPPKKNQKVPKSKFLRAFQQSLIVVPRPQKT